ncbi:unnamed protein product [Ambrosiozyma monospora]|uniref:Unnamed protein product n=1 Tax=Ambrosiozyma monospora TaxID=43982 RepID=A0A9W6Z0N5_AMBMO|nr:unnamed protein product [Ambrosiozyma monospora]
MPTFEETSIAVVDRINMEISRPVNVVLGLFTSGTFLFPFYGIIYFFRNPALWVLYLQTLPPTIIIYTWVYLSVLFLLAPLNVSVSIACMGPPGFFLGYGITVQEINFISHYILSNYFIPMPLTILFDTVLYTEGLDRVVFPGKLKRVVGPSFGDKVVQSAIWLPITFPLSCLSFIRFVIIRCIPVIGPIVTYMNNLTKRGNSSQRRFYRLRKFRKRQVRYLMKEREGEYMAFGLVCTILESIPVLGPFFNFTNQIGGALMAVHYYKKGRVNF